MSLTNDGAESYGGSFHSSRDQETRYAADRIIGILFKRFPEIKSVVDVGCGVGTFLSAAKTNGALVIKGMDGPWVKKEELVIPLSDFEAKDLRDLAEVDGVYDLAISLEVAEHLPQEKAEDFVGFLCNSAPIVLFSAAIPGQGGVGHENEAWQSYWSALFEIFGFYPLDIVRPKIWSDSGIYFWYRQNTLVYVKKNAEAGLYSKELPPLSSGVFDIVHPELYLSKLQNAKVGMVRRVFRKIASLAGF